jgi:homoserine dehydrogenase
MHLKAGVFGGGVVGGGTYELVKKCLKSGRFAQLGASMEISKICVRSLDKPRDYEIDQNCTFVTNYDDILQDVEINTVVELMGGVTHAKDVVFAAIKSGKHVITANKALIATHLDEIQALLKENPTVQFAYEAAVCGGIPIIHAMQSEFYADDLTRVMGIMNGTTNFMLCKMEDEGASYNTVLKEAQDLGFAEADPTADVEGFDVQAKISILAKLCYGKTVDPSTVPTKGISSITDVDFEYAKIMKSTIKLLGCAQTNPDGSLAVFVSPMMVPLTSTLASAKGPGNMVAVSSENMGASTFAGPGAGRYPTANSVLNDMIRLSMGTASKPFPLEAEVAIKNDYETTFYVRISCSDALGIVRDVGEAAESSGVGINAILQNSITDSKDVSFAVATEKAMLSQVTAFAEKIAAKKWCNAAPFFMPIM